jgi:hypothetical protein
VAYDCGVYKCQIDSPRIKSSDNQDMHTCPATQLNNIAVINAIRPIALRATPTPIPVFALVGSPIDDVVEDVGELGSEKAEWDDSCGCEGVVVLVIADTY